MFSRLIQTTKYLINSHQIRSVINNKNAQYILKPRPHQDTVLDTKSYFGTSNTMASKGEAVNFQYVKSATNKEDNLIIDVREPKELQETGKIPNSVNIPVGQIATTLSSMNEDEFCEKFGRSKPSKDFPIIVSCRSGKRSTLVCQELLKLGFCNVSNYTGGWLDWEENNK